MKIDYKLECAAFLKIKESGEKITVRKYCDRRQLELGKPFSFFYFKKVMRKVKGPKRPRPIPPSTDTPPKTENDTPNDTPSVADLICKIMGLHYLISDFLAQPSLGKRYPFQTPFSCPWRDKCRGLNAGVDVSESDSIAAQNTLETIGECPIQNEEVA